MNKRHRGIPLYLSCIVGILKMCLGSIGAANNAVMFDRYREDIDVLPDDIEGLVSASRKSKTRSIPSPGTGAPVLTS